MRPRQQQWRVAIALMLGSVAAFGQVIGSANIHPAVADPAPPAPPAAPQPPGAPGQRQAPPPPPVPQYTPPPPPKKHGPAPPGVAAVVNGESITTKQLADEAVLQSGSKALSFLIIKTLLDQDAKKQNATPTDAEINDQIDQQREKIKQRMPGKTLEELLSQSGMTMEGFRESIYMQTEASNVVSKQVKPAVLMHVKEILVSTIAPGGGPKPPHTDAEAQAILAKAQADLTAGKSWDDVVKTYSESAADKDKGGDLGIISPTAMLDPALVRTAVATKVGAVSAPFKTQQGWELITVVSSSANPPAAEQVAYAQSAKAYEQQQLPQLIQAYVTQLKAKADVTNYLYDTPF